MSGYSALDERRTSCYALVDQARKALRLHVRGLLVQQKGYVQRQGVDRCLCVKRSRQGIAQGTYR